MVGVGSGIGCWLFFTEVVRKIWFFEMNMIYLLVILSFASLCSVGSVAFIDMGKRHQSHGRRLFGCVLGVLALLGIATVFIMVLLYPESAGI